jgi:hypothetical protein
MGEWNTVFEDEVEGRQVSVKVYRSSAEADREESMRFCGAAYGALEGNPH